MWISIYFRSGVLAMMMNKWKQVAKKWGVIGLLAACIIAGFISLLKNTRTQAEESSPFLGQLAAFMNRQMEREFFQIPRYLEAGGVRDYPFQKVEEMIAGQFLLYKFLLLTEETNKEQEDAFMARLIGRQEGTDEDFKNIDEEHLDYGEDALHIENSVLEEMERENQNHLHMEENVEAEEEEGQADGSDGEGLQASIFKEAPYPAFSYDWSEQWDYEALVSNFYAVDNSTLLKEEYMDLDRLLGQDLSVDKETEGPQILIYHTHSRESFIDSVEGDRSTTIVGAGDRLAELLQDKYGFWVLHYTEEFDTERDDAYNNSLPVITQILEENPTIEVVIDLHRDAVLGDRKLVMDLQGRPTARFMFFNGLSYGRKSGEITYLENPYIQENLAFSFQAQVAANEYYPGIARKVYLKAYRFNMHLKPKSMLIELGAQNNTVEEIMNACEPLAHVLAIVLDGDM